jgi:hypothetical protein
MATDPVEYPATMGTATIDKNQNHKVHLGLPTANGGQTLNGFLGGFEALLEVDP